MYLFRLKMFGLKRDVLNYFFIYISKDIGNKNNYSC